MWPVRDGARLHVELRVAGAILAFNGAVPILNKDMTLCISLSARPSNNGTRFHNHLYEQLGLNWIYKAFAPTDLGQAIAGVRGLGIRGCAVSMPYKEDVIALIDVMDPSAKAIDSVNTIVNDGGRLTAYNTDYTAIEQLLQSNAVPTDYSVLVLGSGGMAKATVAALRDAGFKDVTVVARNEGSGRVLAEQYGFAWRAELGSAASSTGTADMIINVTPIGMAGGPDAAALPFPQEAIDAAKVVFDVVALPAETPLIKAGRAAGKTVITGAEVATIQALEQFVLYTGVRPTDEQIRAAEEFTRAQ
jgi:shikimate dehydrogenase